MDNNMLIILLCSFAGTLSYGTIKHIINTKNNNKIKYLKVTDHLRKMQKFDKKFKESCNAKLK